MALYQTPELLRGDHDVVGHIYHRSLGSLWVDWVRWPTDYYAYDRLCLGNPNDRETNGEDPWFRRIQTTDKRLDPVVP